MDQVVRDKSGRFLKGRSGNTAGRKPSSVDKRNGSSPRPWGCFQQAVELKHVLQALPIPLSSN